jgi:hypothetical protein
MAHTQKLSRPDEELVGRPAVVRWDAPSSDLLTEDRSVYGVVDLQTDFVDPDVVQCPVHLDLAARVIDVLEAAMLKQRLLGFSKG